MKKIYDNMNIYILIDVHADVCSYIWTCTSQDNALNMYMISHCIIHGSMAHADMHHIGSDILQNFNILFHMYST